MAGYVLKVKTKSGQHILKNLKPESTLGELKKMLSELTKIPISNLNILSGFPPKVVDLSKNGDLKSCGIHSGDTLIIEEKNEPLSSTVNNKTSVPKFENNESYSNVQEDINSCPGILMKHVVPADNSCLFTSIHYVLNGKDDTGGVAQWMRQLIAETVSKNQDVYSEAVLGKPNSDYCKWIKDDKSWGGAIEISILANYYGIEIAVVDTINAIINRFGEDQDYPLRVFLLFDGIHYDPLYLEPLEGGPIQTMFQTSDDVMLREAEQLAKEAKSSRQFTDVDKFTLKCLVCNVHMKGQVQAQQHAQSTGHMNFGEV